MEKVSVIIPAYNRAETIKKAIESVLNQTYKNIEVIVVDDNSSDNTREVVNNINDDRLRYIKLDENKGACFARNLGVKVASADLIAFQDSDDEWFLNKLEEQVTFLLKTDSDIVSCMMNQVTDDGVKLFPQHIIDDKAISQLVLWESFISTQTILAKKKCFINIMFDERMPRFQDWELMIAMSKHYKISFLNKVLVNAFIQNDSISKNNNKAVRALQIINEKYGDGKKLSSFYYRHMGWYSLEDNERSKEFFIKSFKLNCFDMRNIILLILCKLNLYYIIKLLSKRK